MLPLGFGWSLWIHLFVQHPKSVAAVLAIVLLSSAPAEKIGLAGGERSVGRTVVCTVIPAAPRTFCEEATGSR